MDMSHSGYFYFSCNSTVATFCCRCRLQNWCVTREIFLATCLATFVARQVARKIALCNMALRLAFLILDKGAYGRFETRTSSRNLFIGLCDLQLVLYLAIGALYSAEVSFRTRLENLGDRGNGAPGSWRKGKRKRARWTRFRSLSPFSRHFSTKEASAEEREG